MPEMDSHSLLECLAGALETMARVTLAPATPDESPAKDSLRVRLEVRGPEVYELELVAPRALGAIVAANLLGIDAGSPQALAQASDALKDVVNITAGILLHQLALEGAAGTITAPEAAPTNTESYSASGKAGDVSAAAFADGLLLHIRWGPRGSES